MNRRSTSYLLKRYGKAKAPWPETIPTDHPVTIPLPGFKMVNTLNARENWRTRGGRESKEKGF